MSVFALELIQEAATAGGPAILNLPLLMRRLQVDLPESLLAHFRADAPPPDSPGPRYLCDTLMRMTHVMLSLYLILKRQFLLQVEVFIQVRSSTVGRARLRVLASSLCATMHSTAGAFQVCVQCAQPPAA